MDKEQFTIIKSSMEDILKKIRELEIKIDKLTNYELYEKYE